jgi:hypothetical protein
MARENIKMVAEEETGVSETAKHEGGKRKSSGVKNNRRHRGAAKRHLGVIIFANSGAETAKLWRRQQPAPAFGVREKQTSVVI